MRTLLLLAVAAPLAIAAPIPKDFRAKQPSFPTAVGTKWEYVIQGTDTLDHVREVTSRDREKDGSYTFEETWTDAAGRATGAADPSASSVALRAPCDAPGSDKLFTACISALD